VLFAVSIDKKGIKMAEAMHDHSRYHM